MLKNQNFFDGRIQWIEETDFRSNVLDAIDDRLFTCFFTDDDIVYRPISSDLLFQLDDETVLCFSLRLGKNLRVSYSRNRPMALRGDISLGEQFLKWKWTESPFDFGYPLSLDGHIFRTEEIRYLTESISFQNPNTYEASLQTLTFPPRDYMTSYQHSVLVNSPNNIVQNVFPNRRAEVHAYSTRYLNSAYLAGNIIDIESIDFTNIIGCHQELFLPLIKTTTV